MKNRLLALHVLFLCIFCSIAVLTMMGHFPWITNFLMLSAAILFFIILQSWLKFVQSILKKVDEALAGKSVDISSLWSFANLDSLDQKQDQVKRKITVAAELISNLAHPEKMGSSQDLSADDPIGKALHSIKVEMKRMKDEDDKQSWITQGLAQFSSILREKAEIKEYAHRIISNVVRYVQANQGGLYMEYHDEAKERYLQLEASYAYGKRRFVDARIAPGEGLLGQCMFEKDFIFITDVPKSYVKITSGLGEATPRNIVIIPLIFNETFCGAIELASFEILQSHQIEFLKKVSEDIASEIVSLRTVEQTKKLLEESNVLTTELQAREEEMKQNLEELAATQEEISRKQSELAGIINAIDSTLGTAELNVLGEIVRHNLILENCLGLKNDQSKRYDFRLMTGDAVPSWNAILNGEVTAGDFKTKTIAGNVIWLSITFTVIRDTNQNISKVLCLAQDITQKKIKEKEFERLSLVANNTDNAVVITDHRGITEYVNAGFIKMTGYQPSEIIGKKPGDLLQGEDTNQETIARIRQNLMNKQPIYEEILNYDKSGKSYWVSLAINPIVNQQGEVEQYIAIQANITATKNAAMDYRYKLEAISRSNAIVEFTTTGLIIDANENFLKLTGYQKEELIGQHHKIFMPAEEWDKPSYQEFWRRLGRGEFISDEFSRITKSGNKIWLKGIYNPILDMNGKPKKIVKFAVNITEEKRLELLAERKQKELDSYLNGINNTIASAEFDINGRFISANEIFLKVMNFQSEEIQGKSFDFFMGDEQTTIMMWENLRLGKFFSGEFKMKDHDGKENWLIGTFNPICIEDSTPAKIMMFAQFTTQEKEKLNDFGTMVQAVKYTLPVIEFNPNFTCKTANEKALKLFSLSRLEVKNKTILHFLAPYYQSAWKNQETACLGNDFSTMHLPLNLNGHIHNYEVSFSLVKNLEGKVCKVIVLLVREVNEPISILAAS